MSNAEERFIEFARQHGRATCEGDAPATNRAYKNLITALHEIKRTPDNGESFLLASLTNSDLSVVKWAALYLLPLREAEAVAALERVAGSGIPRIAFGAKMTLSEWRAGRLRFG